MESVNIIDIKYSNLNTLKKIAVLIFLLIPLTNGKVFILNGIAITFQFFNLIIRSLTEGIDTGYLNEIILIIIALTSVILMLNKKLFIIGSTVSVLWLLYISKS